MTVGATPSGVPPDVSASNDSGAAQAGVLPSVPGGMTVGVLPVDLISLSDDDPEDKEGYEASGDDGRLKLSKGNRNAVIKRILSPSVRAILLQS
jgi:hypothetical protein